MKLSKKRNEKGFTLAELLIVVAIIAVLVAIAIPIFTTQLEKSREATDTANVRSAYADVMAEFIIDGSAHSMTVSAQQTQSGWQNSENGYITTQINGTESRTPFSAVTKSEGKYEVKISPDSASGATLTISKAS